MKQTICNRTYDTENAKLIAKTNINELNNFSASNYIAVDDFTYYEISLYQKKNGEYFLYARGNGLSLFNRKVSDGYTQGQYLIPIDNELVDIITHSQNVADLSYNSKFSKENQRQVQFEEKLSYLPVNENHYDVRKIKAVFTSR